MEEVVEALKREVESKDVRLKSLVKEMEAREDALRSLRVELQGVKVRHEEALGLSEKYIAEARLSRDEEVSRLEEEFALYKNEVEARERRVEREHRDAMVSLEGKMDALKSLNGKVRQENEVLLSEMKKKESVMRDVERERQRAVNKFDAAMKSLEQLEYQYDVLEKDAKETEAVEESAYFGFGGGGGGAACVSGARDAGWSARACGIGRRVGGAGGGAEDGGAKV
eukprot:jgi/Picre1/32808/NNA_008138.t1